jgi:hypothetical protein
MVRKLQKDAPKETKRRLFGKKKAKNR